MTCAACTSVAILVRLRSINWHDRRIWQILQTGNCEPLLEKVKTKIELLFQHRCERRCTEMHLTVEEEKQSLKSNHAKVMELDHPSSSEEEEEHNTDDVNFHTDSSEEEDDDW